jgi:predicted AlkP superfamily phosphohydrolase/phosphomutase
MFNVDAVDWSATSAYRVRMLAPIEGIEVNLRGRQAQGIVSPGAEYEKVRDELLEHLSELREPSTGERLVKEAFKREHLYSGPYLEHAPDVVFELRAGYEGGPGVKPPIIRPIPQSFLKMRSGNHTMDGIFVAKGAAAQPGVDFGQIGLADVTPTILYYLGQAIPENMDGQVAETMFVNEFVEGHVARRQGSVKTARSDRGDFSEDEEEAMRKQLKALGYL